MNHTEVKPVEVVVTKADIKRALVEAGIVSGDILLVHSSFKSMGTIEGGADTVISAMLEVLGEEGTLLFPTLCQKDWENVYRNWNVNTSPSDVGYLTNYFRLLPGALRSDQATHSVAAIGKHAAYITADHGKSGRRYGIYGDTPFAVDSPWEKLFALRGKILLLGVNYMKVTMRHFVEYRLLDRYLKSLIGDPSYEDFKRQVWCYDRFEEKGVWPTLYNLKVGVHLESLGLIQKSTCGNAEFTVIPAFDFVNIMDEQMEHFPEEWMPENFVAWLKEVRETENNKARNFAEEATARRKELEEKPFSR